MGETITEILNADKAGLARATKLLREGQLVSFPTETVYGLGADAGNDLAVAKIFEAKNRPTFNPLIIHVADTEAAREFAEFDDQAERLAATFWPGPLTMVLPLRPDANISGLVSAGLSTVAVRVPIHPIARQLLVLFGGPIAAPSANPSGKISPTRVEHVIAGLDGKIAGILDGGACSVGLESTIVGFRPGPTLLRPGGLPLEEIEACLGEGLATALPEKTPTAPGQLASHYAPEASIRLNAESKLDDEVLLGFGNMECDLNLSESGDLVEAAANLFHHLRELDAKGAKHIAVSEIPDRGLGRAINDRLKRAAAPRG